MAAHKCHRCMQEISEQDARCPHCGSPQVRSHRKAILMAVASGMLLTLLLIVFLMIRHESRPAEPEPDSDTPSSTAPDKPPPLNQ